MGKSNLIVIVLIAFLLLPAFCAAEPSTNERVYLYSRINPSVVYGDNVVFTVEVYTAREGVEEVWAYRVDKSFRLRDDGVPPDRVAGDGVYTGVVNLTGQFFSFRFFWGTTSANNVIGIRIKMASGEVKEYEGAMFSVVRPGVKFPVVKLGDGLYATQYAFFIVDKRREIFPDFPLDDIYCSKTFPEAYKKLYSVFPDVFDFITLMPAGNIYKKKDYAENVPYYVPVKNDVKNIGLSLFNDAEKYGSAGRLRGVIYHSFGYGAILDHEVGHAWGVDIGKSLGITTDKHHYVSNSDIYGQMSEFYVYNGEYYKFIDNGDGTFKAVKNLEMEGTVPYAPLTLYAMGLIPPEEVPPIHILEGELDFSEPNKVKPESIRTITIWDIIEAEGGERDPPYEEAQKNFTMAFIIVKPEEFTPAEYTFFSLISKFFSSCERGEHYLTPFCTATGGRGHMNTTLPIVISTFKVSASPTSLEGTRGEKVSLEVTVEAVHGYDKTVQVWVEGLPRNFAVTVNPPSGKPTFKSTVKISIPEDAEGSYVFKVVAYSPEDDWREDVEGIVLRVAKGDFQLVADVTEGKVEKGGKITFTLQVVQVKGFRDAVSLEVVSGPPGVTITISPKQGTPPFTSTISVKVSEKAPTGRGCLKVVATGGGITHDKVFCLEIYEAGVKIEKLYLYLTAALVVVLIILAIVIKKM